ncbi:MAG: GNAT family N-acetyltransferase [Candidatus Thorarchaeota archaeon]|nr:GNAT family N-acetyltransferase [Candidatus Thorarchaeota archaeon]
MMIFVVRRAQSKEDMDFFFKLGFETMMKTEERRQFYDEMMKNNPDASDDELFELHRKEVEGYFDFDNPHARVFVVKREVSENYCGYLWMGLRNSEDAWDFERPQWIYDIVVDSKYRGHGLGRMLLEKADAFAFELNLNIGLFVHTGNDPAIALYKKSGYNIKVVPISKKLNSESQDRVNDEFVIRQEKKTERENVLEIGLDRFKKKVRFSIDVDDKAIEKRYTEYVSAYEKNPEEHQRLLALTRDGDIAGFAWAGISSFNEKIAMIYEFLICDNFRESGVRDRLLGFIEKWAKNKGFFTMYILLHSEDDLDIEFFKSNDYIVPGYFMEKRLKPE